MYLFLSPKRETLNLSTCPDSSKQICVTSHISCVMCMCHPSRVTFHISPVTCYLSPTPTATITDPPPANSPTMHSRLVNQDRTQIPPKNSEPKNGRKLYKKGVIRFAILAITSSTRCLLVLVADGGDKQQQHIHGHGNS